MLVQVICQDQVVGHTQTVRFHRMVWAIVVSTDFFVVVIAYSFPRDHAFGHALQATSFPCSRKVEHEGLWRLLENFELPARLRGVRGDSSATDRFVGRSSTATLNEKSFILLLKGSCLNLCEP